MSRNAMVKNDQTAPRGGVSPKMTIGESSYLGVGMLVPNSSLASL